MMFEQPVALAGMTGQHLGLGLDDAGKRYVLSLTRAGLVTLEPKTGKVFFHFPFRSRTNASVNAATPIVVDDQIFISASY